jgi:hypothetical protein
MIKQRTTEHSDELIKQITNVFDKVFEMYTQKLQSTLPGFGRSQPGKSQQEFGLLVPEYNVGIYRKAGEPSVGPSGLIIGYFFDVRIEADEDEFKTGDDVLRVIELFLKNIDREHMLNKIRDRFETIVQNDVIKNIMPEFAEGGEAPEVDPRTGKVTSRAEREEAEREKSAKEQAVDELSTMFEIKKQIKKHLKENLPFGGYAPALAGTVGSNLGATAPIQGVDNAPATGRDTSVSAKIVLHRNGKVLLIKNDKGWDLPGGHIKEDENILSGLMREVFEETGLTLSSEDITSLNMKHGNKKFYCGEFTTDDVSLSDEHYEHGFFTLQEINNLNNLFDPFKKAIKKCLNKGQPENNNLIIRIG